MLLILSFLQLFFQLNAPIDKTIPTYYLTRIELIQLLGPNSPSGQRSKTTAFKFYQEGDLLKLHAFAGRNINNDFTTKIELGIHPGLRHETLSGDFYVGDVEFSVRNRGNGNRNDMDDLRALLNNDSNIRFVLLRPLIKTFTINGIPHPTLTFEIYPATDLSTTSYEALIAVPPSISSPNPSPPYGRSQ
ncbi:hypothetical protein [Daejeonella oryzae]|uniref:hypothetical protein n=1 Tax=Daejeonella oryzae TaxID=1122943 RepID=UPI000402C0D5|nr:hypothetical protein [Daejeonella oryzae]